MQIQRLPRYSRHVLITKFAVVAAVAMRLGKAVRLAAAMASLICTMRMSGTMTTLAEIAMVRAVGVRVLVAAIRTEITNPRVDTNDWRRVDDRRHRNDLCAPPKARSAIRDEASAPNAQTGTKK